MTVSATTKLMLYSRLLFRRPVECWDRLSTLIEVRSDRSRVESPEFLVGPPSENVRSLSRALGCDVEQFLSESALHEIEAETAFRMAQSLALDRLDKRHNADPSLARICYALCRALKPKTVIETGVAYGITTAYLLKAMECNCHGHLWSIDLPPLAPGAEESVGRAIPEYLRSRWTLYRGKSVRILPDLARKVSPVDMFIHDSLHTYRNELFEFETVWPHLVSGGILVADDIEGHRAWLDWEHQILPRTSAVFEESTKLRANSGELGFAPKFGVMIKA